VIARESDVREYSNIVRSLSHNKGKGRKEPLGRNYQVARFVIHDWETVHRARTTADEQQKGAFPNSDHVGIVRRTRNYVSLERGKKETGD
jgi:hypothetical protein